MWVIANGAPKTGSTWPAQLLKSSGQFEALPTEVQNPSWVNSSIQDEIAGEFADALASSKTRYWSKQHWASRHKEFLGIEGIKVLNSIRDVRDTVVSRYYHDVRLFGVETPISAYLREKAAGLVGQFCDYQRYWIDAAAVRPESYHICSYERLSKDPVSSARELFAFCGLELSQEELDRAVFDSSIENVISRGPGKFFRKGKVHAFADDLSDADIELVTSLAEANGLRKIKNQIADFSPVLRPYLEMTDTGL